MTRWRVLIVALILLLATAQPVLAQGGGGQVVFGDDFVLLAGERLEGDLVVFGGDVLLEEGSTVDGAVLVFGGSVRAAGRIEGDVTTLGGEVTLAETAMVAGNVLATGGTVRDVRAVVRGTVIGGGDARESRPVPPFRASRFPWPWGLDWRGGVDTVAGVAAWILQTIVVALAVATVGALVVLLIPGLAAVAGGVLVERPVECVGAGLLTGLAAALALPLLAITCIGIPVAFAGVLALAIALLYGWVVAGLAVGERVLIALRAERRPVAAVAVGVSILTVLSRMPGLGPLFAALLGAWGLGAVVLTRFGTMPYTGSRARPAPPAALPGPPGDIAGDVG